MMRSELIRYRSERGDHEGLLVYAPPDEGRMPQIDRPVLLMAPNWLGVTAAARERAALIAGDRYVVFVADLYGAQRRPADWQEAAAMSAPIREQPTLARELMRSALETATRESRGRGLSDGAQRAAVGFCFGGGNVLELARSGADIQAVVSIHGDLATSSPAQSGTVRAAVLALHAAADPVVPLAAVQAFQQEMETAGVHWQMHLFGGLLHAYTDAGADVPGVARYDQAGARQSYALMHTFIADSMRQPAR